MASSEKIMSIKKGCYLEEKGGGCYTFELVALVVVELALLVELANDN